MTTVIEAARIMPTTAVASDVPTDLISALTPFASPVCETGTQRMMRAGIAE